jgi:hypothetical protein
LLHVGDSVLSCTAVTEHANHDALNTATSTAPLKWYSGVRVLCGEVRQVRFEAANLDEARTLSAGCTMGLLGEIHEETFVRPVLQEAFNEKETRQKLGGISRSTLYRLLAKGFLHRCPGTRLLRITSKSIEAYLSLGGLRRDSHYH